MDSKKIEKTGERPPDKERLKERLSELQYNVTQQNGTEPPFSNEYWDHFEPGIYVDVVTGDALFSSKDKFHSDCGWPSFSQPVDPSAVKNLPDKSLGMLRVEVRSQTSNSHLGHVFEDGPKQSGGLRYCINSAALRFIPKRDMESAGYGHLLHWAE